MRFFSKLVKPKNAVSVALKVSKIVQRLKDELKDDYDWKKHVCEPSLIEYIGRLIEGEFQKKKVVDGKINKRNVLLEILEKLINTTLTVQEKDIIYAIVEHLHSTGRFKLVSNSRVVKNVLSSFLYSS